ncbi:hypothetical protein [Kitasatospora cheerisanensis]|uniref:Uncharacterized protein n=1 Tax=Kitasatospora cheerisanensis KCTC 2395 TaxID=1348663 RepID=A0A066YNV8_9ACTN|nr:hypothetical protein [Kitasatospora cheerisanensis]KDN83183.1 hypothetical protein KCH_46650 [Kitasatospora cheerisanensis KCTC 2395]
MKPFARTVAFAGLLLAFAGAAPAVVAAARPGAAAVVRADATPSGDTSWGGSCELPLCQPELY